MIKFPIGIKEELTTFIGSELLKKHLINLVWISWNLKSFIEYILGGNLSTGEGN